MKVLVRLAVVCSVWLGVAQGRSVPYHSSEELYWENLFNREPYLDYSSDEHWCGTDWNSLFNTGVNTDWGTDWMNSNNAGREVEEPTVDNNITPVDHEVSGDQEVTTEPNIPSESDITTENSLGLNDFEPDRAWRTSNRDLEIDSNFLFNTDINPNWETDWMNSNNNGGEGGEPTVVNNTPNDQKVLRGQEVTTESNVPSESDITTENSLGLNDFEPDSAWRTSNRDLEIDSNFLFNTDININWETDWMNSNNNGGEGGEPTVVNDTPNDQEVLRGQEVTTESNVPSESDITTENSWGWNGLGADGVWDNTNRNLGADWNSLFNTDVNTNWGTDWMNSDNAGREGEEQTVSSSNAPDGQEIFIGQEDVTEPSVLSESDTTTDSLSHVGYDIINGGDAPGDVEVVVLEYDDAFPETVHELFDRLRSLDNSQ